MTIYVIMRYEGYDYGSDIVGVFSKLEIATDQAVLYIEQMEASVFEDEEDGDEEEDSQFRNDFTFRPVAINERKGMSAVWTNNNDTRIVIFPMELDSPAQYSV